MKYLISILFFTFTVNTFATSAVENFNINVDLVKDIIIDLEVVEVDKLPVNSQGNLNNTIAFQCNYTVEWLYNECPFIERIVALV